jgi:hypothetical protein
MRQAKEPHSFYIPVMGTGFTIDTPLFVAKYGISSVVSLVDDVLIEQMRKYWSEKYGEPYEPIGVHEEDRRAKRITAYLNLLNKLIKKQIAEIKKSDFGPESEITKYFELLAEDHEPKKLYEQMLGEKDEKKKKELQDQLRESIVPGSIDVNIMTKLDRENFSNGESLPYKFNDAAAALRGFANSELSSTIVLSAGFNPHLYGYLTEFEDFFPDKNSLIKKKICLKVSDYRSAEIQGKYLAKRGIWVSEYRVESAVNCGGHAFINDGQLLGPILAEFKRRKDDLVKTLHGFYEKTLNTLKKFCSDVPQKIKITAQGGLGTSDEHKFLLNHYALDGIGWASPFLMVPEATNVDKVTLKKLIDAKAEDLFMSSSSPMGIPFWNLKNSPSEEHRCELIKNGTPGSVCVKGYIKLNKELTKEAVCPASKKYQKLKLEQLEKSDMSPELLALTKEDVLSKSCICHDLGGGVLVRRDIDPRATPAICPGPNIINFKKISTLKEMIGHIYGRLSLLSNNNRPHVFIRELQLQIDNLLNEARKLSLGLPARSQQKLSEVKANLIQGMDYYKNIAKEIFHGQQEKFLSVLQELRDEIEKISLSDMVMS